MTADPRARNGARPSDATVVTRLNHGFRNPGWSWDAPVSIGRNAAPNAGNHFSAALAVHASPRMILRIAVGRAEFGAGAAIVVSRTSGRMRRRPVCESSVRSIDRSPDISVGLITAVPT